MARTIGIGIQNFDKIRKNHYFYIDKTSFIKECFSVDYGNRGDLFDGLSIWQEEKYREIQETYPVISLSFANIKEQDYQTTREKICQLLTDLYTDHSFLLESSVLEPGDREFFHRVNVNMDVPGQIIMILCRHCCLAIKRL